MFFLRHMIFITSPLPPHSSLFTLLSSAAALLLLLLPSLLVLLLLLLCCCWDAVADPVGTAGASCVFLSGCFSFRVDFLHFCLIFLSFTSMLNI